jgi:serine/threonine protein kinase
MCRGKPFCATPVACSPSPSSKNSSRASAFLKRSLAARTQTFVDEEVDQLTSTCRFLGQASSDSTTPTFDKDELIISETPLGKGSFSQVHQVQAINLVNHNHAGFDECEHDCTSTNNNSLRSQLAQAVAKGTTKVVIKHLQENLLQNRRKFHSAAADLVLEGKLLEAFEHPNIVKVHGVCSQGTSAFADGSASGYFLVLEHLDQTLDDLPLEISFSHKVQMASQLSKALSYLHQHDFVFRDLKPQNVGLTEDGTVKLFDFGLCRELPEASPELNQVFAMSGVGTRKYMSPEVWRGQAYNCKADVYSLAIVLYELFSGKRAFDLYNKDMHQMFVIDEGERPTIPSDWPVELQELLQRCWSDSPNDRPTMAAVVTILESLQAQFPYQKPADSSHRPRSKSPLRRMLQGLFAARKAPAVVGSSNKKFTIRRSTTNPTTTLSTILVD